MVFSPISTSLFVPFTEVLYKVFLVINIEVLYIVFLDLKTNDLTNCL